MHTQNLTCARARHRAAGALVRTACADALTLRAAWATRSGCAPLTACIRTPCCTDAPNSACSQCQPAALHRRTELGFAFRVRVVCPQFAVARGAQRVSRALAHLAARCITLPFIKATGTIRLHMRAVLMTCVLAGTQRPAPRPRTHTPKSTPPGARDLRPHWRANTRAAPAHTYTEKHAARCS